MSPMHRHGRWAVCNQLGLILRLLTYDDPRNIDSICHTPEVDRTPTAGTLSIHSRRVTNRTHSECSAVDFTPVKAG